MEDYNTNYVNRSSETLYSKVSFSSNPIKKSSISTNYNTQINSNNKSSKMRD